MMPLDAPNSHILLAEDSPEIREVVEGMLETLGYTVTSVANGREALNALELDAPDLILSDVRMPELDGFGLLKAVRESPVLFNTPFIVVSAKSEKAEVRMGMALGADDYVTKPFEPDSLAKTISVRLERGRRLREVEKRQHEFLLRTLPHELRTPLTGIIGYSDLMVAAASEGQGLTNQELREYGEGIKTSGERLYTIVKGFLLWAAIEGARSNRVPAQRRHSESVTKRELQAICATLGGSYGRANDARVADFADVTVAVAVPGVYHVLRELVDNGLKNSLPGQTIDISCTSSESTVAFEIRDHGRGMTGDQISKVGVFKQFNRPKNEQQGLGLGLAVAFSFAEASMGALQLRPEAQGLTVRLSLPVFTTGDVRQRESCPIGAAGGTRR